MATQQARTRNEKFFTSAHAAADLLLLAWDQADRELKELEAQAAAALADLQQEWAEKLRLPKEKRARLGAALEDLGKQQQETFFGVVGPPPVSCSVDLPHGTLLYDKTEYVVKPRKVDVLANLEKYGFEEAIRRTAAVDWEALDDPQEWPDELLAIIGTRREAKETYGFGVKEA